MVGLEKLQKYGLVPESLLLVVGGTWVVVYLLFEVFTLSDACRLYEMGFPKLLPGQ
jgi:hypothetical protein